MPGRKPDPLGQLIGGIAFIAVMFYIFVWPPLIAWWEVNGWIVLTTLGIIGGSFLVWFIFKLVKPDYSPISHRTPTTSFTDNDGVRHTFFDSASEPETSATMLGMIIHEIESFEPFRQFQFENQYQIQLGEHLRNRFDRVQLERQIGSSRPDIVIDKIAIEIKGPTKSRALQTISDKILRYYNNFESVIIVLFDVQVTPQHYSEWHNGITQHYPRVRVIRKGEVT